MAQRHNESLTQLLASWSRDQPGSEEALIRRVYGELHQLATTYLRRERSDHTLQPTALIHEAYLRFSHASEGPWENRSHFFAVAAQAMRRVLVDHARKQRAHKRAAVGKLIPLERVAIPVEERPRRLIALDDALSNLEEIDPLKARVVELRFFAGFTNPEVAEILSCSRATVERHWSLAQAWLYRELSA
jgi:RNA polymerase sigma factor (TIGR02999 family)